MHKLRKDLEISGNNLMIGNVHVDEFVLGGREKQKIGKSYNTKKKEAIIALELQTMVS